MRKSHTLRHYPRPSLALGTDDLGMLREGDESNEDVLRRQLLDKDRENDKLQSQIQALQGQLLQRPSLEGVQQLEKEYRDLELLLQGTQRENERCMAELERCKAREKMLERELAKLAGENWQSSLDIAPTTAITSRFHQRSATMSSSRSISPLHPQLSTMHSQENATPSNDQQATLAHIEQVRLLILGMEQRLQGREEKLMQAIDKAEAEGKNFENISDELKSITAW